MGELMDFQFLKQKTPDERPWHSLVLMMLVGLFASTVVNKALGLESC